MNLEALESTLPNGLHDAGILAISVDYPSATASLDLSVNVGTPDGPDPEQHRRGRLTIRGLGCLVFDPPEVRLSPGDSGGLWITTVEPDTPKLSPALEGLIRATPQGAFCSRIYVVEWNSFIHLPAQTAEFLWAPAENPGHGQGHE